MRQQFDHYETPRWMINCLYDHANIRGSILDPAAGQNLAIARYFSMIGHKTETNDLYFDSSEWQLDATEAETWDQFEEPDWVVMNPPFDQALPILKLAREKARVGVASLLRVTFDEMVISKSNHNRVQWWVEHPEAMQIKMPRYCFAPNKNGDPSVDSAYYQWVIWLKPGVRFTYPRPIIRIPHYDIPGFHRKSLMFSDPISA